MRHLGGLDLSSPFVDAALAGGQRLHVAIPDVTRTDWAVNIRKYVVRAAHLGDLVALGSLTPLAARFLTASVQAGLNILVSGPTQAGKATRCQPTRRFRPTVNLPRSCRVSRAVMHPQNLRDSCKDVGCSTYAGVLTLPLG